MYLCLQTHKYDIFTAKKSFLTDKLAYFHDDLPMKKLFLILMILLQVLSEAAARPKVGVVLSGGGAKGTAHVGVLKVLERAGIPIDFIVGTSMGAIVGSLYSIGYSPEELDSIMMKQDWKQLLSDQQKRENMSLESKEESDRYILPRKAAGCHQRRCAPRTEHRQHALGTDRGLSRLDRLPENADTLCLCFAGCGDGKGDCTHLGRASHCRAGQHVAAGHLRAGGSG